jgi:hypothetical protein
MIVASVVALAAVVWLTMRMVGAGMVGAALAVIGGSLWLRPVHDTLNQGQVNLLLMALVVADFALVRKRGLGALIGIATAMKTDACRLYSLPVVNPADSRGDHCGGCNGRPHRARLPCRPGRLIAFLAPRCLYGHGLANPPNYPRGRIQQIHQWRPHTAPSVIST